MRCSLHIIYKNAQLTFMGISSKLQDGILVARHRGIGEHALRSNSAFYRFFAVLTVQRSMMKRRNYLICSIIAMLSIVSYACETEYAICEGCGISGGDQNQNQNGTVNTGNTGNTGGSGEDSNNPSGGENAGGSGEDSNNPSGGENAGNNGEGNGPGETVCNGDIQKCAEDLNGKQVCEGGKWENNEACNYCFNKNTDNSDAASLVCDGCEPNKYELPKPSESSKSFYTKACYNGVWRELKPIEPSAGARTDNMALNTGEDKDVWGFVLNEGILDDNEYARHFNCHNNVLKDEIIYCMNNKDTGSKNKCELKCCNAGDYYIKHTGYKYYSVEVCRKVVFGEGTKADFWAYKYTGELNDSLIGKKKSLPYSLCYDGNLLIANNKNISKNQHSVYKLFVCPSNYGCNEKYDELCVIEEFEYNDEMEFKCKTKGDFIQGGESIIYDETSVAECPDNTTLEIQNEDGSWSACKDLKFKLNQARCVPMGIQIGLSSGAAK